MALFFGVKVFNAKKEELRPWSPLTLKQTLELLRDFKSSWWIGGGYAIENFVGEQYRKHDDVDIVILRQDLEKLKSYLSKWDLYPSDPPGTLTPWKKDYFPSNKVHDIWARKDNESDWAFQLMVNDATDENFCYKRDHSILFNIKEHTRLGKYGIRYLSPELQLLYKGKRIRDKDQVDFDKALPLLNRTQKNWLSENLKRCYSQEHPWLQKLSI